MKFSLTVLKGVCSLFYCVLKDSNYTQFTLPIYRNHKLCEIWMKSPSYDLECTNIVKNFKISYLFGFPAFKNLNLFINILNFL